MILTKLIWLQDRYEGLLGLCLSRLDQLIYWSFWPRNISKALVLGSAALLWLHGLEANLIGHVKHYSDLKKFSDGIQPA